VHVLGSECIPGSAHQ